jgi:hypothetical protein
VETEIRKICTCPSPDLPLNQNVILRNIVFSSKVFSSKVFSSKVLTLKVFLRTFFLRTFFLRKFFLRKFSFESSFFESSFFESSFFERFSSKVLSSTLQKFFSLSRFVRKKNPTMAIEKNVFIVGSVPFWLLDFFVRPET